MLSSQPCVCMCVLMWQTSEREREQWMLKEQQNAIWRYVLAFGLSFFGLDDDSMHAKDLSLTHSSRLP
jgi:hypothetical protein